MRSRDSLVPQPARCRLACAPRPVLRLRRTDFAETPARGSVLRRDVHSRRIVESVVVGQAFQPDKLSKNVRVSLERLTYATARCGKALRDCPRGTPRP